MIACRKNDVSQATLRPARTSDKHWQRQYREFRDRRGKGGRGVMRNVLLQAESIRCACFVHLGVSMPEDKSGDVLERHCAFVASAFIHWNSKEMTPSRLFSTRGNNMHRSHRRIMKTTKLACALPKKAASRFRPDGESRAVALPWQACLRDLACPAHRCQSTSVGL